MIVELDDSLGCNAKCNCATVKHSIVVVVGVGCDSISSRFATLPSSPHHFLSSFSLDFCALENPTLVPARPIALFAYFTLAPTLCIDPKSQLARKDSLSQLRAVTPLLMQAALPTVRWLGSKAIHTCMFIVQVQLRKSRKQVEDERMM